MSHSERRRQFSAALLAAAGTSVVGRSTLAREVPASRAVARAAGSGSAGATPVAVVAAASAQPAASRAAGASGARAAGDASVAASKPSAGTGAAGTDASGGGTSDAGTSGAAAAPTGATAAASPGQGRTLPSLPASLSLDFDVYYGDYTDRGIQVAGAVYRLKQQGGRYRLSTEARANGVLAVFYSGTLEQVSEGLLGGQGFVPDRYSEKRGRRPERQYTFDPKTRRVRQLGDPAIDYPFPEGTQDRLSIFFQLGLLARADASRFRAGETFVLPLAGSRRIDEPFFQVSRQEKIRTNAGVFDAVHVAVSRPGDSDAPRFDIWLSPSLKMLPVRIRVFDHGGGGKIIDQVLRNRPQGV